MPRFVPVDPELAEWLKAETDLYGVVTRLQTSSVPPFGHYRLAGKETLFLKVLSPDQAQHHSLADALAQCAKDGGAPALPPLRWVKTHSGPFIGIYPYIAGRFGEPTEHDAIQLGTALARLHWALRSCRLAKRVRKASNARMALLEARRQKIIVGIGPAGPSRELARKLLLSFAAPFQPGEDGQIIHSDLNLGNVLFDRATGMPTFIDFESAAGSWLPPIIDVAMAVQRLCLTADVEPRVKGAACSALLKSYRKESGCSFSAAALVKAIYWISMRNICLLAEIEDSGRQVADSEWHKFFYLADLVTEFAPLMHAAVQESK